MAIELERSGTLALVACVISLAACRPGSDGDPVSSETGQDGGTEEGTETGEQPSEPLEVGWIGVEQELLVGQAYFVPVASLEASLVLASGSTADVTLGDADDGRFSIPLFALAAASEPIAAVRFTSPDDVLEIPLFVEPPALSSQLDRRAELADWRAAVNQALSVAGMSEADVDPWGALPLSLGNDPLRLQAMDQALKVPLDLVPTGRKALLELSVTATSMESTLRTAATMRQWPVPDSLPQPATPGADSPPALGGLVAAVEQAHAVLADLDRSDFDLVAGARQGNMQSWLQTTPGQTKLLPVAEALDQAALVRAGLLVARAVDRLRALDVIDVGEPVTMELDCGPLVIGTDGDDEHSAGACLIVDPGGNDHYDHAGTTVDGPITVVVDLGGTDVHVGDAGILGVSVVADLGGDNDTYEAENLAQGAGVLGIGIVLDEGGADSYHGLEGVQGFGWHGIGLLFDLGGDDVYTADVLAQGSSIPGGFGALIEVRGNDSYEVGGVYPDLARNDLEHFLGFGQGFSTGTVFDAGNPVGIPGGWGVLLDVSGDDLYQAEVMVQGSGYFFGIGALFDVSGDDVYQAYNYAHAQAVHGAAAVLIDVLGSDDYFAPKRAQGRGDDRSTAVFLEDAGDDVYANPDKTGQGAAARAGFGLFSDREGDDVYTAGIQAQGWASVDDSPPQYPPMSVMIDFDGNDSYQSHDADGGNDKTWVQNARGVGADL